MRTSTLFVCALVAGCAGRYRTELVGRGNAIVQARTEVAADASAPTDPVATPWAVGRGMQLPAGTYQLAMWFDVPRAQVIDWTVSCPGAELSGTAGEPFAVYRERRLAELRDQRARERERVAAVSGLVVGALAPHAVATGQAGPVRVQATAGVDAQAAGDAIAERAVPDDVLLPAGDVGAGRMAATAEVTTASAGLCVVTAVADDATVIGTYQVSRVRDLEEEARTAARAEHARGMAVRTRLQARLVAHGADPELRIRARRAAVEAQYAARAKAEAEAELQARLRADLEERWRIMALHARAELRGRCEGHGADPNRRARIAEEQRIAMEAEARLRADVEARRLELVVRARTSLRERLVRFGAIPRPPMPAPLPEEPGTAPFEGAIWIADTWVWADGRWQWRAGGWSDPDVFTEVGGDGVVAGDEGYDGAAILEDLGLAVGVGAASEVSGGSRDHRRATPDRQIRDHRHATTSNIRDHRAAQPAWTPSRSDPPPRERRDDEHRSDKREDKKREDKKDDGGGGRMIRDHRR